MREIGLLVGHRGGSSNPSCNKAAGCGHARDYSRAANSRDDDYDGNPKRTARQQDRQGAPLGGTRVGKWPGLLPLARERPD